MANTKGIANIGRVASKSYDFGPLTNLEDTWIGDTGFNLMVVPQPAGDGTITFLVMIQQLFETHVFDRVGAPVPNRSGTDHNPYNGREQIIAVKYSQIVAENVSKNILHQEVGMWLYQTPPPPLPPPATPPPLNPRFGWSTPIPGFEATFPITRQGIIPHGNSMLLAGNYSYDNAPAFPPQTQSYYPIIVQVNGSDTIPPELQTALNKIYQDQIDTALLALPPNQTAGLTSDNFINPTSLLALDPSIQFNDVTNLHANSANAAGFGGVDSIPFAHKFAFPVDFDAYLSIQNVINPDYPASDPSPTPDNNTDEVPDFLQIQYFQNIRIQFTIEFMGSSLMVQFPHFEVNRLIKI